jgi:purine-nucleoside phosphorylase
MVEGKNGICTFNGMGIITINHNPPVLYDNYRIRYCITVGLEITKTTIYMVSRFFLRAKYWPESPSARTHEFQVIAKSISPSLPFKYP